jgi:transposase
MHYAYASSAPLRRKSSSQAAGHDGKVSHFACIGGDLKSLDKAIAKLLESGKEPRVLYQAGPCGFVIYRHLKKRGIECGVVSPAGVPKKPGDRVKTDRRDSKTLAVQHRAGSLGAIYVPELEDEAMRDLVRAREDAIHNRHRARQRINSFVLRHGRVFSGAKKKWGAVHRRWLAEQ